jgi:class 3 adenylate cyclase
VGRYACYLRRPQPASTRPRIGTRFRASCIRWVFWTGRPCLVAQASKPDVLGGRAGARPRKRQLLPMRRIDGAKSTFREDVPLPTGTVTYLFTDIEGSTQRWDRFPGAMRSAVERHDDIVRREIGANRGYVFKTVGDAFCAAFESAGDAVAAVSLACRHADGSRRFPRRVGVGPYQGQRRRDWWRNRRSCRRGRGVD